jgi:hypothetical protein
MEHAGVPVAEDVSVTRKQIRKGAVRFGALWRQARRCVAVDVVEDLGLRYLANHCAHVADP